jgi:hypothetical protein
MRLKMTANSREELLQSIHPEYKNASLSRKTELLDGFTTATGYNRKYAMQLLKKGPAAVSRKRKRPLVYDDKVKSALVIVWHAANNVCAKRLIPFLPQFLESLERFGRITIDEATRGKLLKMSPATADRLLKATKAHHGKNPALTRTGNLLRKHIEIRTFADWNENVPGYFEADTVGHHGGNIRGSYIHSLTLTDIATGWTEMVPLLHKTEHATVDGIEKIKEGLVFGLLGLDTDNGMEFMNYGLIDWCERQSITFTRSREYKKNDQCYVEEKNGSVVRKLLGHHRYEGLRAWHLIAELYKLARTYVNFFQPSVKLESKSRDGAKVSRKYDKAKTPYQRLLRYDLPDETRQCLKAEFEAADPVLLLNKINMLQLELVQEITPAAEEQPHHTIEPMRIDQKKESEIQPTRSQPSKQSETEVKPIQPKRTTATRAAMEAVSAEFLKAERGEVLLVRDLLKCAKADLVRSSLVKLSERGLIERISWGKYTRIEDVAAFGNAVIDRRCRGLTAEIRSHFLEHPTAVVHVQELLHYGSSMQVRSTVSKLYKQGFIERCGLAQYRRASEKIMKNNLRTTRQQRREKAESGAVNRI